ncbi:MAG: Gfo/Idh/MocA family oxidoreductase [Bryobacteraceae bacterium]|nr:Gfo/Idh/MocA family oxidoreductase [Bryobacteraceae bacterium]
MIERRDFVKAGSVAAVYSLVGGRPAAAAVGASDKVGLGFIGVGIRGSALLEDFSKNSASRFVVCADLYDGYLQHAREFCKAKASTDVETTKRYEDVLNRKDIDAVVIATPDHWHKRITLDALAAGKHVYCEKPMTWNLKEGPEIIAAEKKSGKCVMIGSGGKTAAMTQKVKELLAQKAIGKVSLIRMANYRNNAEGAWRYAIPPDASPETIDWNRWLGTAPKRPFTAEHFFRWRCWWEYSGGVATDLFVHMLTTLHEVTGSHAPVSAVSQGGLWFWKDGRTVPDVLETVFEYPENYLAEMCVHQKNGADAPALVAYGSDGTLIWDRNKITVLGEAEDKDIQNYGTYAWPKAAKEAYLRSKGVDPANPRGLWGKDPDPKEYKVPAGPNHSDFFIDSVREGKPSRENATEGHAAAGAAHIANMSYREGRKIKWDFATNKVTG